MTKFSKLDFILVHWTCVSFPGSFYTKLVITGKKIMHIFCSRRNIQLKNCLWSLLQSHNCAAHIEYMCYRLDVCWNGRRGFLHYSAADIARGLCTQLAQSVVSMMSATLPCPLSLRTWKNRPRVVPGIGIIYRGHLVS